MRFVTFLDPERKIEVPGLQVGTMGDGTLIAIPPALSHLGRGETPRTVIDIIEHWSTLEAPLRELEKMAAEKRLPPGTSFAEKSAILLSPVPRPPSMRDGYAFRQHVESARKGRGLPMIPEFDLFPIFYYTNHLSVSGPGRISVQKMARERLDFELESAIVLGKAGKNIPATRADEHVFGYLIMNDWSARALQTEEMKLNLGPAKGKDFSTSLGPYLVTKDELASKKLSGPTGDRYDLRMRCWVNGKQVSDGNMKDMTFTFAQILERVSYGVNVYPGEVIGSGTVGTGCFMELNGSKITDNQWLQPGDEVILEIDGLGRLVNTIEAAD